MNNPADPTLAMRWDIEQVVGFDTETGLMAGLNVIPDIVSLATGELHAESKVIETDLAAVADEDGELLDTHIRWLFEYAGKDRLKVATNAKFDLAVLARKCPDLLPAIFEQIDEGRIHCTQIREKLLNLATTGDLGFDRLPDGSSRPVRYNHAALVLKYLGVDISASKSGDDNWRTNYEALRGVPSKDWPEEASKYACDDAAQLLGIWQGQEERREEIMEQKGIDPFAELPFRVGVDFCLYLMTAQGVRVDPEEYASIREMLAEELKPENLQHLIDYKILRPGKPPQPYKNGAKHEDGTPKMTKGVKPSIDKKRLTDFVLKLAEEFDEMELRYTQPTDKFPEGQLKTDAEFFDDYHHLHPVLDEYRNRQKLQKLVTTELPRMEIEPGVPAPVVHPNFDVLKRTGRTSSFASDLYPSFNCQNVDPRARGMVIARDGYALVSIDYNCMELGTLAQKCLDLFGMSVHAEKINAGIDLHGFLASQLAARLDNDFRHYCQSTPGLSDRDAIYAEFASLKGCGDKEAEAKFDHWRMFAKPTGLGYPGGLSHKTFVQYAKATYGIIVSQQEAMECKEVWEATYPEMPLYFEWIKNNCLDPFNVKVFEDKETGEKKQKPAYHYISPLGLYRAGADYCAAANGAGLQTFSADGVLLGLWGVVRACYDSSIESILLLDDRGVTARPLMLIHDEIVMEVRRDEMFTQRVREVQRLMAEAMMVVTPDVTARTEAAAMLRWSKKAKPKHDAEGNLIPWDAPETETDEAQEAAAAAA